MKKVRIRVFGDVQGVFYRYSAKKLASKLGLKGWCRNEGDGSVQMVIEGDPQLIDSFVDWSKKGPPMARVDKIEVNEETRGAAEGKFEVR